MSKDITELVSVENGKSVTTSLTVAEIFGKQHKDILKAIRELDCPEYFNWRNFSLVDYKDAKCEHPDLFDGFENLLGVN